MKNVIVVILGVILAAALIVGEVLFSGFVFRQLWVWFIFGTLTEFVPSIAQAIGISLVAGFLFHGHKREDYAKPGDSETLKRIKIVVAPFVLTAFSWGLGAIIHLFV